MSEPVTASSGQLVAVHLIGVPVSTWSEAQERTDELLREFTLVAADLREQGAHSEVPVRLMELIEALTARYGALSVDQEAQLAAAAEGGVDTIDDLVFEVPPEAAEASLQLQGMLDEADAYCRAGEHLLTLASPPDVVRFRNWYLEEFPRQLSGEPPTAWGDYRS